VLGVAETVPERIKGLVRSTRESTPGAVQVRWAGGEEDEDEDEDMEEREQKPGPGKKGWLGGWFGRG
jgi:hypothetical protein